MDEYPVRDAPQCASVDYDRISGVLAMARELWPEATLVPMWTPSSEDRVHVEVWRDNRANVLGEKVIGDRYCEHIGAVAA